MGIILTYQTKINSKKMFKTHSVENNKLSKQIEALDELEQLEKIQGVRSLQSVMKLRKLEKLSLKPSSSRAIRRKLSKKFSQITETVKDKFMSVNNNHSYEPNPKHENEPKGFSFMCSPM